MTKEQMEFLKGSLTQQIDGFSFWKKDKTTKKPVLGRINYNCRLSKIIRTLPVWNHRTISTAQI